MWLVIMRKHRFRLSHMIPNAWFYRLTDIKMVNKPAAAAAYNYYYSSLTTSKTNSFCYTPKLHQLHTSPTPNTINKHPIIYTQPTESTRLSDGLASTSCTCGRVIDSSSTTDDVELNEKSYAKKIQDSSNEWIQELELDQKPPPIITKPKNKEETCIKSLISIQETVSGVEIRSNSNSSKKERVWKTIVRGKNDLKRQNIINKKNSSLLDAGCCIVKSSFDPQKDFKESMVEIIAGNNIRTSSDLEKLLACYLSLNSIEYHDTIIKAFEQIWFTSDFVV